MYFYELFSHSDRFSYRAHIISSATCVLILCTALTLLPPFLLTYYTGDFWTKESVYSEQPRLDNTTKYILIADNTGADTGTNGFFMSSYSTLNDNFKENILYGSKTESSSDIDGDGLIDQFRISFDFEISSSSVIIRNINIWLIFQFELLEKQRINMETIALISIVPPYTLTPASNTNLTVYGQLIFEQNNAIQSAGNDSTYNESIINTDSSSPPPDLNSILDDYFTRKYYTSYQKQYTWLTPRTSTDSNIITINVIVNIGRQSIRYVPGFWQDFKWGWIQYISVLLPFLIVFNRLKLFVFSNHLVRTLVPLSILRHKA
jgi:transmembrane protein 231